MLVSDGPFSVKEFRRESDIEVCPAGDCVGVGGSRQRRDDEIAEGIVSVNF